MKLLARRRPPAWALLIAAAIFAALAFYGLGSGETFMPGGRGSRGQHVIQSQDPSQFLKIVRVQLIFGALFATLGFVRVVPIEDFFSGLQRSVNARLKHDRAPAPLCAYAFPLGFIGLIIWIGWKVMYSE